MLKTKIIRMIIDKYDPREKHYPLIYAYRDGDYCRGRDPEDPNLVYHFKMHNVKIILEKVSL